MLHTSRFISTYTTVVQKSEVMIPLGIPGAYISIILKSILS
jgi:hypothetical protein